MKRARLLELTASLPPCLIGMEACPCAHHWAREMARQGHPVRLIAPKFVAPCRMSGKRGKNDAAAICEAVARPTMRFVPVKNIAQQSELFLPRARQGYVEQRTALITRIRGRLSGRGIVLPQKADTIRRELAQLLEDRPGHCNRVVADAITNRERLDARVGEYDRHLAACAKAKADARRPAPDATAGYRPDHGQGPGRLPWRRA